jgi:hypothetical protein
MPTRPADDTNVKPSRRGFGQGHTITRFQLRVLVKEKFGWLQILPELFIFQGKC